MRVCLQGFMCVVAVAFIMGANMSYADVDEGVFFSKVKYTSPSMSPSGKYFIQVERIVNSYRLLITDLDKSEIIYNPLVGRGYPSNLVWISDRRVMYQQDGNLIAINIDGTEHRYVVKNIPDLEGRYRGPLWYKANVRAWSVLHTLPGQPDEILTQKITADGVAHVYKNNIFTGEESEVVSGKKRKINSWVIDKKGRVIAGIREKKGKFDMFFITQTANNGVESHSFGDEGEEIIVQKKPGFSSSGKGYLDSNFSVLEGSYSPGIVYVSEATETNTYRLSAYSFIENRVVDVIHEDSEYDIGGKFYSPILHFYGPDQVLVGVTYYRSSEYTKWFDERFDNVQKRLDKMYPNRVNRLLQWSDDLSKFLIYSHSANSLGQYYIYYPSKNRIVLQSDEDVVFNDMPMPETEVVHYKSPDGLVHESYLTLPVGYENDALPLVVMVHGGPWSRYVVDYDAEALFFASKGYAVLRANFRGSVGFGTAYFRAGDKNLGSLMIDDVAAGAKWAIQQGYADVDRIYAMGASYGGYAALMSAIRYPDLYKAVVSLAAPLDLAAQIKHYKKSKNYYGYEVWNSMVGKDKKSRGFLQEMSPFHNVDKLKIPYLVFHGDKDNVVPVEQAENFKKDLKRIGADKNVYIIRREGHGFTHTSNQLFYVNKALKLFNKSSIKN